MKTYWITFRIADQSAGGRTYEARYNALSDAVHKHAGTHWWAEPTSFWLVNSESSQAQIAASIKQALNIGVDLAVIGIVDYKGITVIGNAEKLADLKALVPDIRQG